MGVAPTLIASLGALQDFVGREVGASDWLTITQERIDLFAEATEDRQWIHVDRERAEHESPFQTTIAHGFLTLSLVAHFMQQAIKIGSPLRMAVNYGLNRVRFTSPVRRGARIRARIVLLSLKNIAADAVEAVYAVTVECEGSEKPCCVAESIVRYYSQATSGA
jgi:acyl dehydratase